ncbi:NAD(P)H-binding protein [Thermithiobacillus plumbiphilus]|uniref:NAD(P)H-binding protein n=1 Tax=Thermithiobacillus plumbiphilus TaxID=1729899 RepID=A0ABU9DCZ8_9PROT
MRVLVTGASGFIGKHLVRHLLDAGHEVTGSTRNPAKLQQTIPGLRAIAADFATDHDPAVWQPRVAGMDVVINATGIFEERGKQNFMAVHRDAPIALFRACQTAGVRRVIQISALGADAQASTAFHLSKKAADDQLASSSLDWAIIYPSIVYGPGEASMGFFKAIAALPLIPLVGNGEQQVQPIHVEDLCRGIQRLVESRKPLHTRLPAVGPEPVTFRRLLEILRAWLGDRPAPMLTTPLALARPGADLLGRLGVAPVNADGISMLLRGNTASPAAWVERTGVKPRSLQQAFPPGAATEAERWHARLFFLKPLLRLSLALVWIITGLLSLGIYPIADSHALLARTGLHGIPASIALYGAALLDLVLGLALLFRYHLQGIALLQILVMLTFSVIIAIALPEFWLHPYGPLLKNLPMITATLVMMALEKR